MGEIGGYPGERDSVLDKLSGSAFLPLSVDEKASVDLGVAFVKGGVEAVSEDSRHGERGRVARCWSDEEEWAREFIFGRVSRSGGEVHDVWVTNSN